MNLQPLSLDLGKLDGLSPKLIASHHENNYAGAVKRLGAIRQQLGVLDWGSAPVFVINGLNAKSWSPPTRLICTSCTSTRSAATACCLRQACRLR